MNCQKRRHGPKPRLATAALMLLVSAPCLANPPIPTGEDVPLARPMLAQVDDKDLGREETLEELKEEEYDKESWSATSAIGLSLIPGGGFGLIYAESPAASVIPFLLSAAGYSLGVTYLLGVFNEESSPICTHVPTGNSDLDLEECDFNDTRPAEPDPRSPEMKRYFDTATDYQEGTKGEDFDGKTTGLIIIGGTYAATTLLGAVWSASIVSSHNDQLRKRIEQTAMAPRPILAVGPERGYLGLAMDF